MTTDERIAALEAQVCALAIQVAALAARGVPSMPPTLPVVPFPPPAFPWPITTCDGTPGLQTPTAPDFTAPGDLSYGGTS